MSERVTVTLAKDVPLARIESLAAKESQSRNSMINNMLRAGLAYYHEEQVRLMAQQAIGHPVARSVYLSATELLGTQVTTQQEFQSLCEVLKSLLS